MNYPLYSTIMIICVIMSAYFSATETAFSTANRARLKTYAEKGNKRANLVLELIDKYDKFISTVLIGNNIVNILLTALATIVFVALVGGDAGATVSTAVSTVIVLIFGEITPKSIAKNKPEKFAMFSAPLIKVLIYVFAPLNVLFSLWRSLVSKMFKFDEESKMSQEELLTIVDEVAEEGGIDESESELIRNAIEFGELEAKDILTHRVDLEGVPSTATNEEVSERFSETKFSRLLVYEDTIDNIVGIVHQKDFYSAKGITEEKLTDIMTPPVFIHRSEKIDDLLNLLQKSKSHIAVVIDEYGGTLGIVTMEDIIEELVGDIWDEHDEVVVFFEETGENVWRTDCAVALDEFCQKFDVEAETESVSLGGFVTEQLGKIAEVGDEFDYENLHIEVLEIDSHIPTFVSVTICEREAGEEGIAE